MTQSLNCIFLYTVCFGILIVSLNTTFYLFFHVYTEISQNVWSWKFGLKSWKSIGQNVYEPWPYIASFVFERGVDALGDPSPVPGGQGGVPLLQTAVSDAPGVAVLKEKQLPTNHWHCIKVRVARIRL